VAQEHVQAEVQEAEQRLPRHVAIIMDGNGRWANARNLPRYLGHREGVKAVRRVVEACINHNIETLTLFAFSSENWRRPRQEVGLLMDLFVRTLKKEVSRLDRNGVRMRFIGDRGAFDERLQSLMDSAESRTAGNHNLNLVIAVNYGGRWDVTQAARRLAQRVERGELSADDIDGELMAGELCIADLPEPDLFIRTGGEQRISNYLIWQLAYTELYFTDLLWPDFNADTLQQALTFFAGRQRRFGRTGDQVEQAEGAQASNSKCIADGAAGGAGGTKAGHDEFCNCHHSHHVAGRLGVGCARAIARVAGEGRLSVIGCYSVCGIVGVRAA
jgi:undecaprenyl diphosphate synthase